MSSVLHDLSEAAQKRADRFMTIYVREFPNIERENEYIILGTHSYLFQTTQRRMVREKIKIEEGVYETPSALARDYLKITYGRGPRGTAHQLKMLNGIEPVPSYAAPRKFAHGLYVDIQACYWSIMLITGWDVDYLPGLWLSPGRPPADFPFPDHKVARNCLVSAGRTNLRDEHGNPIGTPRYNPKLKPGHPYDQILLDPRLKNNHLPRLIHDVLNTIAVQCIDEGAIYFNNDGLIAPSPSIADRCAGIISDWGLTGRVKAEGGGQVKASGTYQIGRARTLNYENNNIAPIRNVCKLSYRRWLQQEFSHFAAKGNSL